MKMQSHRLVALSLTAIMFLLLPSMLSAQQYVYANNDDDSGGDNNQVTAFKVSNAGQMSVINTYPTGGLGTGGYNALNSIVAAKVGSNVCLFVSNGGSNNVSAFTLKPSDGTLTLVPGSPFATGGLGNNYNIGLAVGQDRLFAGNTVSNNISVLKIENGCALKLNHIYATPGSPDGMKVTPNGQFLVEANIGSPDVWQIDYSNGTLTELGPFSSQGATVGVDISCDGTTAYFGDAGSDTQVEVYSISSSGQLTEIDNYSNNEGQNSNNVMLSADGKLLYVGEVESNQVETLSVGANGALTFDSVVSLHVQQFNSTLGMATVPSGKGIFVAEDSPAQIAVLAARGTSLIEVPHSPFVINDNFAFVIGITAVPGKSCK